MILVTNWEAVDKDDYYLSKDWIENGGKENIKEARKLQKNDELYEAYIVNAVDYAIYYQMDARKVFINSDMDVILNCESAIISNGMEKAIKYEY